MYFVQLEQEMNLIVDRPDMKTAFLREWTKFVPAITSHGEKHQQEYPKSSGFTERPGYVFMHVYASCTCMHALNYCFFLHM